MCYRITNCIQKILTESDNKNNFGTNIRTRFGYIGYLDIFYVFTHQNQNHSDPGGTNSNLIHKFIISMWRLISKPKKNNLERNNLYLNEYPNVHN